MKTALVIIALILAAKTGFADSGDAYMTFTKGGVAHPTNAADCVWLKGASASILYDSLNVKEHQNPGEAAAKFVHLDGKVPSKRFLVCYAATAQTEAECYMGDIPSAK